jgi:hypothetical protein
MLLGQVKETAPDQELRVTDYRTLPVVIEEIRPNKYDLSKEAIQTRTELRIRSVGLRPVERTLEDHYLYVNINLSTTTTAFSLNIDFKRDVSWMSPSRNLVTQVASVWDLGTLGTGGTSGNVLESLEGLLDRFLNAYLKANQDGK